MTSRRISIERATLVVMDIEKLDGAIGFNIDVSAHVLRSIGGTNLSIYIHDKRNQQSTR
ncbi:MAG: hypothetical protein ACFFE2_10335 [Candidatus Thorarchaeota archaeon]